MVDQSAVYGGFGARAIAYVIDIVITLAVFLLVQFVTGPEYFEESDPEFDNVVEMWRYWVDLLLGLEEFDMSDNVAFNWFSFLLSPVYFILFNCLKSATPGKMALGLVIVDAETGEKPTVGQFIGRNAAAYLSAVPLCLGFFWVAWDKKKQGFHDRLASTMVVKKKAGPEKAQAPFTYSKMEADASSEDSSEES